MIEWLNRELLRYDGLCVCTHVSVSPSVWACMSQHNNIMNRYDIV